MMKMHLNRNRAEGTLLCRALILIMVFLMLLKGPAFTASADNEAQAGSDAAERFALFAENAAGRYFTTTADGFTVLELINAFGKLFASVGYYTESGTLYSYYAAELLPVCLTEPEADCTLTDSSADFFVRLFSNMSFAGNYWPGTTRQLLTLVPGGLHLGNYSGDGDALVSKNSLLLYRNDDAPGITPYGPQMAESMYGLEPDAELTAAIAGTWSTVSESGDEAISVYLSLAADGTAMFLRENGTDQPPLLLKGGFAAARENDHTYRFCYMTSSPSSGAMPYTGCALLTPLPDTLIFAPLPEGYDDILCPTPSAQIKYERQE